MAFSASTSYFHLYRSPGHFSLQLIHYLELNWLYIVIGVLSIGLFVYQFKAIRNFMAKGWEDADQVPASEYSVPGVPWPCCLPFCVILPV